MRKIQFSLAAMTNMGLVRKNNEDNYHVISNVTYNRKAWAPNEVIDLDERGMLLVVADGMGGMNAGEVASEIAIETVKECFTPENITENVLCNKKSIDKFMMDTIVKADRQIKATSQKRPETKGMGTTIVMAWVIEGYMYVAWCGDSRAYIYNPAYGLIRISKDHSYVQTLVDQGKLTDDEAFDFPESNVITNCLCDAGNVKAEPECLANAYELHNNDIILLCSDGLCGMIRDIQIEDVITRQQDNMLLLTDNLIDAALRAAGADNVTICIAKMISGCKQIAASGQAVQPHVNAIQKTQMSGIVPVNHSASSQRGGSRSWMWMACIAAVVAVVVCAFLLWPADNNGGAPDNNVQSGNNYSVFRTTLMAHKSNNAIINTFDQYFDMHRDSIKADGELIQKVAEAAANNGDQSQNKVSYYVYAKLASLMLERPDIDAAINYWGRMCELDRKGFRDYMNDSLKNRLNFNDWDRLQKSEFVQNYYFQLPETKPNKPGNRNNGKGKDKPTTPKEKKEPVKEDDDYQTESVDESATPEPIPDAGNANEAKEPGQDSGNISDDKRSGKLTKNRNEERQ